MTTSVATPQRNGQAVDLRSIPVMGVTEFQENIISGVDQGFRVVTLFGHKQPSSKVRLYAVLAHDAGHSLHVFTADVGASFPSLTHECPQVHLFEREIYEQFHVLPEGHPWLKPVRVHEFGSPRQEETHTPVHRFFKEKGEEVHEVAVGPVHAGVIEPGHFRFQCRGEVVDHLEIHLGYQHRGVEEALVGGPFKRTMLQMEVVAGDTSIGHATAYCQALEALGGMEVSARGQAIRALALELERLANHVGDMGALANDVGFLPTASYCGRLRGEFLNLTAQVCGSRLGRGWVRPGGVAFDLDPDMMQPMLKRLAKAAEDTKEAVDLFFETQSVVGRMETTGTLTRKMSTELGIVGVAARASGCPLDIRTDQPSGWYRKAAVPIALAETGDVMARATVRRLEIERSIAFVQQCLQALPEGPVRAACPQPAPDKLVVTLVEGWRGEVAHVAITDSEGRFARYKVTDPSFHNWMGLAMALRGQQISDFPLCNKSFNLSYCGFDL